MREAYPRTMDSNELVIRKIEDARQAAGSSFAVNGYLFVVRALDFLMERIASASGGRRHVTGQELSVAVKDLSLGEFGPMARTVLDHWGIRRTDDIGRIVYDLIGAGLLGKTDGDRIEDFSNVYDFEEELVKKFRFSVDFL